MVHEIEPLPSKSVSSYKNSRKTPNPSTVDIFYSYIYQNEGQTVLNPFHLQEVGV